MKWGTFKPLSTLQNPQIGKQFWNGDFKHNYSLTCSCSRQYPFQYSSNLYPHHPNFSQSWKPWHETEQITVLDVVNKDIGDRHALKENSHTAEDKITVTVITVITVTLRSLMENMRENKKQGIRRIWRLHFRERQPQKTPFFLGKMIKANETVCEIFKNSYELPFLNTLSNEDFKKNSSALKNSKLIEESFKEILRVENVK